MLLDLNEYVFIVCCGLYGAELWCVQLHFRER